MSTSAGTSANQKDKTGWTDKVWGTVAAFWNHSVITVYPRAVVLWSVWALCRLQSKYQLLQKQWTRLPKTSSTTTSSSDGGNTKSPSLLYKPGAMASPIDGKSLFSMTVGSSYSVSVKNYRRDDIRQMVKQALAVTAADTNPTRVDDEYDTAGTRFYLDYTAMPPQQPRVTPAAADTAVRNPFVQRLTRVFFDPHSLLLHLETEPWMSSLDMLNASIRTKSATPPHIFMVLYYARRLRDSPTEVPLRLWWTSEETEQYVHLGNHLFTREMVYDLMQKQYKFTPTKISEVWRPDEYEVQLFLSNGKQLYLCKEDYIEVVMPSRGFFVKRSGSNEPLDDNDNDNDAEQKEKEKE